MYRQIAGFIVIASTLIAHSLFFNFLTDDSFISFVYARNLAEYGELVFNLGERVEGYTNFLWTLLLAGLLKVGMAPELTSRVLGTLFGVLTLGVVTKIMGLTRTGSHRGRRSVGDLSPALILAVSSGYACWCSGGLETQLYTFLVILGIAFYTANNLTASGPIFALAALTRPEGLLIFALTLVHRRSASFLRDRQLLPTASEIRGAIGFLFIFLPYFAWRYSYYGWIFPNTYYVKSSLGAPANFSSALLGQGLFYVEQWARQSGMLYAAPLALVGAFSHRHFGSLALLISATYLGYTIKMGGDFMGLHRFIMPLFVINALLVAMGLRYLIGQISENTYFRRPALSAAFLLFAFFAWSQARVSRAALEPRADRGIDRPGYLKLYTHDRGLIGKALAPLVTADDFSIVGGAGVQSYYGRLRSVDVFGLVSAKIAHDIRPTNPRPGHQKWAPAPYLVKHYRPTFLFHCYAVHAKPRVYRLCPEAGYFLRNGYEAVTLHVPGLKEHGEYYTFLKAQTRPWPTPRAIDL